MRQILGPLFAIQSILPAMLSISWQKREILEWSVAKRASMTMRRPLFITFKAPTMCPVSVPYFKQLLFASFF